MTDFETTGDVMGDDVMGDDEAELDGEQFAVVGARGRAMRGGGLVRLARRPAWRRQIAPGVAMPGQGLEPLPLVPDNGTGIFSGGGSTGITWTATPQRPFRPERLIAQVARFGPSAAGVVVVSQAILIGAQLSQVDAGAINLEIFAPNAFGVRLNLPATTPGMRIVIPCSLVGVLDAGPPADTIAVTLALLGRVIR